MRSGRSENAKGANPPGTVFRDNCLPIVEAGQALLVDDDYALDDTITLTPTPGHSPCHCCVNIFSKGQRAVVAGDLMHHADPVPRARLVGEAGLGPEAVGGLAAKVLCLRRRHRHADPADPFPAPTVGLIKADGDRFDYRFKRD